MPTNTCALLSSAYLPPIQFYSKLIRYDSILIENFEHFPKQTYRNRCSIFGANGKLDMSVPLHKRGERTPIKDVRISNEYDWQKIHWRSVESAYRCSPFFEYYEHDLAPFFMEKKYNFLLDLNEELISLINKLLKINPQIENTKKYEKLHEGIDDFRTIISPKETINIDKNFVIKPYKQVFDNKYGFIENLSIVDLLFNQGPNTLEYLK